jgi:organic hydroperoxide reductase OsmC/OhrA
VSPVAVRVKVLEYEAAIDSQGQIAAEGCPALGLPDEWEAEHLLLAALLRCSLTSLRHHAKRAGISSRGGGRSTGTITRRDVDGRYAFIRIEAALDVELEPEPAADDVRELLAKAERDCFISASLAVEPRYVWRVNGTALPLDDDEI